MNKRMAIITGAGLIIGFAEALVYYNMGKTEEGEGFKYRIPKGKELAKTMGAVLVTSLLTAAISNGLEKMLTEKQALSTA